MAGSPWSGRAEVPLPDRGGRAIDVLVVERVFDAEGQPISDTIVLERAKGASRQSLRGPTAGSSSCGTARNRTDGDGLIQAFDAPGQPGQRSRRGRRRRGRTGRGDPGERRLGGDVGQCKGCAARRRRRADRPRLRVRRRCVRARLHLRCADRRGRAELDLCRAAARQRFGLRRRRLPRHGRAVDRGHAGQRGCSAPTAR